MTPTLVDGVEVSIYPRSKLSSGRITKSIRRLRRLGLVSAERKKDLAGVLGP
jgi:hypothetical protein